MQTHITQTIIGRITRTIKLVKFLTLTVFILSVASFMLHTAGIAQPIFLYSGVGLLLIGLFMVAYLVRQLRIRRHTQDILELQAALLLHRVFGAGSGLGGGSEEEEEEEEEE